MIFHAILVYIRTQRTKNGDHIILQGRLADGQSYGILVRGFKPRFFILKDDVQKIGDILKTLPYAVQKQSIFWQTMAGRPVCRLEFETSAVMATAHRLLRAAAIACYEGDLSLSQQFLVEHNIRLYFSFTGRPNVGDKVDLRFINPEIHPSAGPWPLEMLNLMAIDIETERTGRIRCISLVQKKSRYILMLDRGLLAEPALAAEMRQYNNEAALLQGFIQTIRQLDPDIITGWNVIGFDMAIILRRIRELGIVAQLGRSRQDAVFTPGNADLPDIVDLPGRQVLDAMRMLRMQPGYFESYSLEYVASQILGRGKREQFVADNKMDTLDALWADDPRSFVLYCLEDSQLVLDILDKTGLINLTLKRSELCGTSISRAWTSIHSFEQLYIGGLHRRGVVAPDLGVDRLPMNESPGGTILFPTSGLFRRVLLFDFKGLYPSIIRTFGIDPLAHIAAGKAPKEGQTLITSPNGSSFLHGNGLLPEILTQFYQLREKAKQEGNDIASYTFKILANSFYGVLGTPGCRFAGSDIATAITSFAREILYWSRDFVQAQGYQVIYGDTDSLFLIPLAQVADRDIFRCGNEMSVRLNIALADWIREKYLVKSYLEIEFENLFAPFFIPPLKSVASQEIQEGLEQASLSSPQGRAKSYAGLAFTEQGFKKKSYELVIKGMEAVRSDWTALARTVQREVLHKILTAAPQSEIADYFSQIIQQIRTPAGFDLLLIKKRLSKPASQYRGSLPPHVRAALIAEKRHHGKQPLRRIQYIMTKTGPQPVAGKPAGIQPDIGWYVNKQILPILQSINAASPYDMTAMITEHFHPDGQIDLWQGR